MRTLLRNGREQVLAFQQKRKREVGQQVGGSFQQDTQERNDSIQFSNCTVDHGGDDVGIEAFTIKKICNAEDKLLAIEIKLKAAEGKLFVGTHEKLGGCCKVAGLRSEGALSYDGEGIELRKDLSVQLDMGVVCLEVSLEDFPALDRFTVPSLLSKGMGNGLELERCWRAHESEGVVVPTPAKFH